MFYDEEIVKYLIIDIDNTICNNYPGRTWEEYDKCCYDTPILPVIKLINCITGDDSIATKASESYMSPYRPISNTRPYRRLVMLTVTPIFITARKDDSRRETMAWLNKHLPNMFIVDNLYMKKTNDERPDPIVKKELLYTFLKEFKAKKEDILYVFEDNVENVEMFKKEGLFVLNVNQKIND